VFWFSLQLLSETFLILRRIQQDIITSVIMSSCKVPLLLSKFNQTLIFSPYFKKYSNTNGMGDELFHAKRRTDRQTILQTRLINNLGTFKKKLQNTAQFKQKKMYPYIFVSLAQQAVTRHQVKRNRQALTVYQFLHRSVYCSKCAYTNWKMYHVETKDYQSIKYGRSLWPFSQHIGYSVATVVAKPFNKFCELNAL